MRPRLLLPTHIWPPCLQRRSCSHYSGIPLRIFSLVNWARTTFIVDSILFHPLWNQVQIDSSKTFVRELAVDTFRNASKTLEYRIEAYERRNSTALWVLKKCSVNREQPSGIALKKKAQAGFILKMRRI